MPEATIDRNLGAFYEIGMALMTIRDERLYRTEFDTFEKYCRDRWEFQRRYANRLIASAQVTEKLGPIGPTPINEAQARPLTKLKPEQQKKAWQQAVDTAPDGKVTARHVQKVVSDMTRREKEEDKNEDNIQPIEKIQKQEVSDAMAFAHIKL